MLTIQLLGPPQILVDGNSVPINRRKSRALVYYLAAQSKPLRREQLIAFFWPDHSRETAQQNLRSTLMILRRALAPDGLQTEGETVALAETVVVDAKQFEKSLDNSSPDPDTLSAILQLYRGPFLEGFSLPDDLNFENWQLANEEYYRRLAVSGLVRLAHLHEERQDYSTAIAALDQALTLNPLQEDLQRDLLRYTYLAGDRPGAILRYETLVRLLDEELGVPPMVETRNLYDAILNDRVSVSPAHPARALVSSQTKQNFFTAPQGIVLPFVGRKKELEILQTAAEAHHLALVVGETGVGKTRLVQEFLKTRSGLVIPVAARELEQSLPYFPILAIFRQIINLPDWAQIRREIWLDELWWDQLAHLVPELAANATRPPSNSGLDETRLWEAASLFLQALARRQLLTLFVDDLHWADNASIGLLGYLAGQNAQAGTPLTLIGTARLVSPQTALGKLIRALTREGCLTSLSVTRLSTDEIQHISTHLSPAYREPLSTWLERNSEGNPYVMVELVRHAHQTGLLSEDGVLNLTSLSASPVVPPSVYTLISERLSSLSPEARQVMDTAVAIGREFDYAVVVRASLLSEDATINALDELVTAGLIHPKNDGRLAYVFDHSLVMEVAWREAGEARHRRFHRRIAEALVSLHHNDLVSTAGLIATHFSEGLAPERSAYYAKTAARQAVRLSAWDEAREFYRMALEGEPADKERYELLSGMGQALAQKGENALAGEVFQEAAQTAQKIGDPLAYDTARLGKAKAHLGQTQLAEVIEISREILARGNPESAQDAEFLWGTALSIAGEDLDGAEEHLERAAKQNTAKDSTLHLTNQAHVVLEMGTLAAQRGKLDKAIDLYQLALHTAQQASSLEAIQFQILSLNNLAYHTHLRGDRDAENYAQTGIQIARVNGVLGMQTYLFSTLGEIKLSQDDLAAAESYLYQGLRLAERFGIAERVAGIRATLGRLALKRGEPAKAVDWFNQSLEQADTLGTRRLSVQVRLWLAPLIDPHLARLHLEEARRLAQASQRVFLPQIEEMLNNR